MSFPGWTVFRGGEFARCPNCGRKLHRVGRQSVTRVRIPPDRTTEPPGAAYPQCRTCHVEYEVITEPATAVRAA